MNDEVWAERERINAEHQEVVERTNREHAEARARRAAERAKAAEDADVSCSYPAHYSECPLRLLLSEQLARTVAK